MLVKDLKPCFEMRLQIFFVSHICVNDIFCYHSFTSYLYQQRQQNRKKKKITLYTWMVDLDEKMVVKGSQESKLI